MNRATRADAVKLAGKLLETKGGLVPVTDREKCDNYHFGRQELRNLLDFIYGGPPESAREYLVGNSFERTDPNG